MNELIKIENNKQYGLVVSSRVVAQELGKEHKNVLRDLDKLFAFGGSHLSHQTIDGENVHSQIIESEYENRGKKYREYLLTKDGLKLYLSQCRGITPDQYKALGVEEIDVVYSYTRFEIAFIDMLEKALAELSIKGYRQYNVDNKYRIDFYIPGKNIAVEYDESQHKHQLKEDKEREKYISSRLGCTFIRLDYQNEDIVNVMKVVKEVM